MTPGKPGPDGSWPTTVFDSPQWLEAWSRATIEKATVLDPAAALYAVESSPFWDGYVEDAEMAPIWDRALLTVGSLYAFYGPAHRLNDPASVMELMERARRRAGSWTRPGCW